MLFVLNSNWEVRCRKMTFYMSQKGEAGTVGRRKGIRFSKLYLSLFNIIDQVLVKHQTYFDQVLFALLILWR